ncbi:hypothetical protein [Leifsonia sp. Root112D2]|uniref:hypothetical protein n=1 Tax=Leifsonia sp. Root112D2 TaxID=1736426 RepID=UPI000B2A518B|nr:hypothetical protein [Leifsonia sp. Root112D2]
MFSALRSCVIVAAAMALSLSGCAPNNVKQGESGALPIATVTIPDAIGFVASTALELIEVTGLHAQLLASDATTVDLSNPETLEVKREVPAPGSEAQRGSIVTLYVQGSPSMTASVSAPSLRPLPAPKRTAAPEPPPPAPAPACPTGQVVFSVLSGWFANVSGDPHSPAYFGFAAGLVTNHSNLTVQISFPPGGWATDDKGHRLVPFAGTWKNGTPNAIPPGGRATFTLNTSIGYPLDLAQSASQFTTNENGANLATFTSAVPGGCSHQASIVDSPPVAAVALE